MTPGNAPTRLVVVADDFGRSSGVNRAVAEAFDRGIVTSASLMAGGAAFEEALGLARARPGLSLGVHVTFCDGRSVLPSSQVPGLVDREGTFEASPARAGLRYWRERRRLLPQLERETAAQFERAAGAGRDLAHVDGHHHLHMHPVLFDLACREASRRGVRWIRVPSSDHRDGGLLEWAVFGILGIRGRRVASRHGLHTSDRVHGLSRTGRLDEAYVMDLLPRLAPGWNELFVHPDLDTGQGRVELQAVSSPRVRDRMSELGVVLAAYGTGGPA